ncbi:hypothetical protein ANCDUO_00456 [Ancylostoma duodenale]|uniref:Uncharacterized protein n=1 Tax=Ancylostoma duodenale TaxID=51022 RepID=A0A0C2HC04_9BILA|nr:hypothetical protein ANCDUO_00456 [Ancylostoma duodenale]
MGALQKMWREIDNSCEHNADMRGMPYLLPSEVRCHKPEVTAQQCTDPRFIFLCTDCSGKGVTSTKSRSSSPKLLSKPETSSQTRGIGVALAPRSGSDISATFEAYKKKKERQVMKAKAALSK